MSDRPRTVWRTDIDTSLLNSSVGDEVIYAVGDIHGCHDLTVALLEAIACDIATLPPGSKPVIIFCGDAIDRGPRSADVLAMLVWMMRHAPCEVECLKGNHEAMMLTFLETPREACAWLDFGGAETLASYGISVSADEPYAEQCEALRDALLDRLPSSHLDLLRQMQRWQIHGDYIFVHAGLRRGKPIAQQTEDDYLWIGDEFLEDDHWFGKVVVHGHSWLSADPEVKAGRIGIDTGAYTTGALTAVKLAGKTVAFVQAVTTEPTAARSPFTLAESLAQVA